MPFTWSDLVEQRSEQVSPPAAVVDRSTIDVIGFERHVIAAPDASGIMLVRDTLKERFSGGIDGEGEAEHIRWLGPNGNATFVGIERIVGAVGGRHGSLSLTCHGTTIDGVVSGAWHVVPGSGTGELAGLRGRGEFTGRQRQDGRWQTTDAFTHWYESDGTERPLSTSPGTSRSQPEAPQHERQRAGSRFSASDGGSVQGPAR